MTHLHYLIIVPACLLLAAICIAMEATALGICIAIVATILHHILRRRIVAHRLIRIAGMVRHST